MHLHSLTRCGQSRVRLIPSSYLDRSSFSQTLIQINDPSISAGILLDAQGNGFAWTDALGQVAVFYTHTDDGICAAFSLANLQSAAPDQQWDQRYIHHYLMGQSSASLTPTASISRLPAACFISLGSVDAEAEPVIPQYYWTPKANPQQASCSLNDCVSALDRLLLSNIEHSLKHAQGKRIGVNISGGLDSTLVAYYVTQCCRKLGYADPIAFTWMSAPTEENKNHIEHRFCRQLAAQLGLQLEYCPTNTQYLAQALQEDVMQGPHSSVLVHEVPVLERAKELNVTEMYHGLGGDEGISFNGRGCMPSVLRHGHLLQWLQLAAKHSPSLKLTLASIPRALLGNYFHPRSLLPELRPRRVGYSLTPDIPLPNFHDLTSYMDSREIQRYCFLYRGLMQDRLQAQAQMGQQYGVHYEYPLLHPDVVQASIDFPRSLIFQNGYSRTLIRALLKGKVDDEIRLKDKLSDEIRSHDLQLALKEILDRLYALIEQGYAPERRSYVDWNNLCEYCMNRGDILDTPHPNPGKLMNALQFLQVGKAIAEYWPEYSNSMNEKHCA